MHPLMTRATYLLAFGLLAIPSHASAQTTSPSGDLATLQAKVDDYVSGATQSEIDSLLSSYSAMKLGQTYTAATPVPPTSDNTNAVWQTMSYTDLSAAQRLGYASDQCASHTKYEQLVAKGVQVDQAKFTSVSDKFCKLVKAGAELYHRYEKLQSIKTNGVVLAKRSRSQEHDFDGYHRTFGVGMELVYMPNIANTLASGIHLDQTFNYNSWMKWSDDSPTTLNIIKKIREMQNSGASACDGFSFHVINGGSVDGWYYVNVGNVSSTELTIQNCAKIDYNGTHKTHGFPDIHVPAPFGYLYELELMKDSAKVQLMDKIKGKVSSMIGDNQEMITLLQKIL